MNCFDCNKCGIVPENKQFRCAKNYKLIATYTDEVIPHLTKSIVNDTACDEHSSIKQTIEVAEE